MCNVHVLSIIDKARRDLLQHQIYMHNFSIAKFVVGRCGGVVGYRVVQ